MHDGKIPSFIETRKGSEFSELVVQDFENGLLGNGFVRQDRPSHPGLWDFLGRIAGKINYSPSQPNTGDSKIIIGMMGLAERQLYPYVLTKQVIPFIWDCWPDREEHWKGLFRRHHFSHIAFTTLEAARFWEAQLPETKVFWLPEAIDVSHFTAGPTLAERNSVLLEIGRRHERAHAVAKRVLAGTDGAHLYREKDGGDFLPTRRDLVGALHNTRALLCYPGSISDPLGRTGTWESMTHRYLEAVATKTLVLGYVPHEMTELFGFEPGITVSETDLPDALDAIGAEVDQFQPLVDRAYRRLLEVATWNIRSNQLKEIITASQP